MVKASPINSLKTFLPIDNYDIHYNTDTLSASFKYMVGSGKVQAISNVVLNIETRTCSFHL